MSQTSLQRRLEVVDCVLPLSCYLGLQRSWPRYSFVTDLCDGGEGRLGPAENPNAEEYERHDEVKVPRREKRLPSPKHLVE